MIMKGLTAIRKRLIVRAVTLYFGLGCVALFYYIFIVRQCAGSIPVSKSYTGGLNCSI